MSPLQAAQEEPQLRLPGRLGQGLPARRRLPDGEGQPQVLQLPGFQERLCWRRRRQRPSPPGGPGAPEAGAAAAGAGGQREADAGGQRQQQLRRLLKPEGPGVPEGAVSPRRAAVALAAGAAESAGFRERKTVLLLSRTERN